jgi:internalin A
MSELAKKLIAENIAKYERGEDASSLDLGNCGLTDLAKQVPELFGLVWLEELTLRDEWWDAGKRGKEKSQNEGAENCLSKVPHTFKRLSELRTLRLGGNYKKNSSGITDISFLGNLPKLNSLDLGSNQISEISTLEKLTGLTYLNLRNNQISDIRFLEKFTGLTSLDISYNQFSNIRLLEKLTGLTSLYLSSNHIDDISFLEKLTNLTSLYMDWNQISDICTLEKLTRLTSLDLSCNQISDVSILSKLTGLTSLYLTGNQIHNTSFLDKLKGLTSLSLGDNKIRSINILEKLNALTTLNLWKNQISDTFFLEKLTGLTTLDLWGNKISDISILGKLNELTSLDLSDNQISDITPLKPIVDQLLYLSIRENPIQYIPNEIYEQEECASDLRAYWQSLDEGQIAINQQLKVMFLGNGCVGKTTLLHWFLDGAFRDLSLEEGRTHGIILQPYQFPNSEVMAHFWDFGGQEVYHATHRLFLGRRTLYLLIWASETIEKEEEMRHPPQYWLDMIADVADKNERSRVLIIQNRFEGQPERNILDDEQRAAYEERGLDIQTFSIDVKGGKGVKPLLATIQEAAEELVDTYQEQLPQSWVEIRTAIGKRKAAREKTLPMDDFEGICQETGEKNNAQIILGYLHRAGELFHYPDRFGGKIILDQQWALKAVYAVLKRERIERYGGKFLVSDLIGFWREDDPMLSAEDAHTFLQFMLDNQTAFFAKNKERGEDPELIVPQLLPEEAPSIIHSLEDIPNRLQHRIDYNFLHRDIISRFIVRTAYLSEQQEYWRQGIHIRRGKAKAAVFVENDADGQPRLSVVCYGQGKEDLLQGIQEELDKIRPLTKAREYRFEKGVWRPYSSSLLGGSGGKSGLAAQSSTQEAVDLQAFFQPLKIFISYSKHDIDPKDTLIKHLSGLRDKVVTWHDRDVLPGEEWDERIKTVLNQSDIVLYLVTHHSMATDYIQNVELPLIEQRCQSGECTLIPIIVDFCHWEDLDFAKYNALPEKGAPITDKERWQNENQAWMKVVLGVKNIYTKRIERSEFGRI